MADQLVALVKMIEAHLLSFGVAVVLCTWASALIGAAITYLTRRDTPPRSFGGFLRFCFPSIILRHKSCRLDVLFVGIGKLIHPFIILPFMAGSVFFAEGTYGGLTLAFGARPQHPESLLLWGTILVIAVLLQDFMTFYVHYLMHRIPALWEIHKVHHSAEFLLPITNRRFHPFQEIIDNFGNMSAVGILLGITSYAFALPVHDNSIIGLDAYFILNLLSFYHLRHSHIPMSYGDRIEWYIMSPKQHHLHHSRADRHWDRNFGLCFAWWDRMFGTLVIADAYEPYDLGLTADEQSAYTSVAALYFTPVFNLVRMALGGLRLLPGPAASAGVPETAEAAMTEAAMTGTGNLGAGSMSTAP
jgi:sterol desaturase/sphingolipid hydroxylase (fatty acid hydroxylase superfamily)